jgi:hypothetical protein
VGITETHDQRGLVCHGGLLVVAAGALGVVVGEPVTVGEPVGVTVGVTVGESDGDGVVLVTVGVGVLVGFLVCVGDGVGLGVVVCAGTTITRGGGGGRTRR